MPMLFEGTYHRPRAANHGMPAVHIKADGELDMSQLLMCITCRMKLVDGECPFAICGRAPDHQRC